MYPEITQTFLCATAGSVAAASFCLLPFGIGYRVVWYSTFGDTCCHVFQGRSLRSRWKGKNEIFKFYIILPPPTPPSMTLRLASVSWPLMGFRDHTQTNTFGRPPLDERSARRTDLYLTTHNTHNRKTSMHRWDSKPQSQKASAVRPHLRTRGCWDQRNSYPAQYIDLTIRKSIITNYLSHTYVPPPCFDFYKVITEVVCTKVQDCKYSKFC